jgi:hypothetical protein
MPELTAQQIKTFERLLAAGFRPVAIAPYENALCVQRGDCAAVLTRLPNGGLRLLAPPSYMIDGNLSVRLKRGQREIFVWKKNEIDATLERLSELAKFRQELTDILEQASSQ